MKVQDLFKKDFSDREVDKIVYARDASDFEGKCQAVVWPAKKEQLIHMMKFCVNGDVNFTIRGAGTNTIGACIPADSVVLDMSRMNNILEWGSDYVVVESGVILAELLKAVQKKQVFFPVKPVEHPVCTIGGMLALNAYGMNTYYGNMQQWVQELEVIDGQGNRLSISGAQLKDFLGMEGTTGIIVHAKIKLLSEPQKKTVSIFKFNTLTALMDKVFILDKNPTVLSIEFFDDFCSSFIGLGQSFHVLVEYSNDAGLIKNPVEIAKLDELKEKVQHSLVNKKYTQNEDPKIPLEQTSKFLHWLQKNGIPCYGHLKLRILHPCFREGSPLTREMYYLVENMKGEVAGQYGIGLKKKRFVPLEKKIRWKALKEKYDPKRTLNKGIAID